MTNGSCPQLFDPFIAGGPLADSLGLDAGQIYWTNRAVGGQCRLVGSTALTDAGLTMVACVDVDGIPRTVNADLAIDTTTADRPFVMAGEAPTQAVCGEFLVPPFMRLEFDPADTFIPFTNAQGQSGAFGMRIRGAYPTALFSGDPCAVEWSNPPTFELVPNCAASDFVDGHIYYVSERVEIDGTLTRYQPGTNPAWCSSNWFSDPGSIGGGISAPALCIRYRVDSANQVTIRSARFYVYYGQASLGGLALAWYRTISTPIQRQADGLFHLGDAFPRTLNPNNNPLVMATGGPRPMVLRDADEPIAFGDPFRLPERRVDWIGGAVPGTGGGCGSSTNGDRTTFVLDYNW